ncbi:MAG: hypothetical protein K2X35_06225 [Bryobacteraceae bacterium]|nr:hypothetical protein [Bryobacteraceae bacterium]
MPRLIILIAGLTAPILAAIFPETAGNYRKTQSRPLAPEDAALFRELGFQEGESARLQGRGGTVEVRAWRFQDSTGAYAASQLLGGGFEQEGNHLVRFSPDPGRKAREEILEAVKPRRQALPVLPTYVPRQNLVKGSERYILGPLGLARVEPGIPPGEAGFDLGGEAQFARYGSGGKGFHLLIFSYPTPGIARDRAAAFQKLPGALVRRSGTMVGVVPEPGDPALAARTLDQINQEVTAVFNSVPPAPPPVQDAMQLVLAAFELAGVLLAACLAAGLIFALVLFTVRRRGYVSGGEAMTSLHLRDK